MTTQGRSLRQSAQQAVLWSAGLNLFRDVLQFAQMLVMVRLLDPAIYGMAGMTTTIINFIGIVSFQHIVPHVLQIRDDSKVNYHQHFTAGLAINALLFVAANLIALGLGFIEQYSQLQPLVHVLSLTYLLSVPIELRAKMLERAHNWSRLRVLQMAGIVISITSGIGMALAGAGVFALIVPGLLGSSIFLFDLFVSSKWRPRWQWDYPSYREALHFGINRAGANALNSGRGLLQTSLISHHFQFQTLGLFGRAEGLANMFCTRVSQEVVNALYPVITRTEARSERFQRISGLVLQAVAWVVFPIAAFFSLEAENIVRVVYGTKWLSVVPLLPWVMALGVTISMGSAAYRLLLANNQSRLCLRSDVMSFAMATAAMVVLIPQGLIPYLIGATIVGVAVGAILILMLIWTKAIQPSRLFAALAPPTIAAIAGCSVSWAAKTLLPDYLPPALQVIPTGFLFAATYVVVLRTLFHKNLTEIIEYMPGGKRVSRFLLLQH